MEGGGAKGAPVDPPLYNTKAKVKELLTFGNAVTTYKYKELIQIILLIETLFFHRLKRLYRPTIQ